MYILYLCNGMDKEDKLLVVNRRDLLNLLYCSLIRDFHVISRRLYWSNPCLSLRCPYIDWDMSCTASVHICSRCAALLRLITQGLPVLSCLKAGLCFHV